MGFLSKDLLLCSLVPPVLGGAVLRPRQYSWGTEGARHPLQKVLNPKIWGSALTWQLVAKGWGTLEAQCC